jgi:hypothetical protein
MSWLIDNANVAYIMLGLVAVGLLTAGWLTRRVKFFLYAGIPLLLIGLVWLLTRTVATDRGQIQHSVETMAEAVVRGDTNELFKHVSRDFRHNKMPREQLAALVKGIVAQHKINHVKIWEFEFEEVSREKRTAKAHFKATVFDNDGILAMVFCIANFTLEDDRWKLHSIDFRNAANPDQPMPGAP